jgi:NADH dehydrogenase
VLVEPDLTIKGHPEIFVVGDAAVQPWKEGRPTPGVAQGGIQGGSYAAKVIRRRILGRPHEPYRYSNHGDVAVIGRLSAVTDIPWMGPFGQQGGFTAWLLWLGIHIAYLIGFTNRLVVLTRWAWSFFTHGRGSRLITGGPLLPPIEEPEPPVMPPDEEATPE